MTTYERLQEHLEDWEDEYWYETKQVVGEGVLPTREEVTSESIRWLCAEIDALRVTK